MRAMVEKLLEQYGMEILVEGRSVRGLFQPVTGRLERLAVREPGPLGLEERLRYVYIGPVEPELQADMELEISGKGYRVRTAGAIPGNDGPCYCWAMCVEKGREEPWGVNTWS